MILSDKQIDQRIARVLTMFTTVRVAALNLSPPIIDNRTIVALTREVLDDIRHDDLVSELPYAGSSR